MSDQVTAYQGAPSTPMPALPATAFLHVWLDIALNDPVGRPVLCPRCRAVAASVEVGRGEPAWFRIGPCGCLFEIVGGG